MIHISFRQGKSHENFPLADTHMGGHITKYLTCCLFMLVGITVAVIFWYFWPYVFVLRRHINFKIREFTTRFSSLRSICFISVAIIISFQRNSHGNRKLLSSSNNKVLNLFKFSVIERVILVKVEEFSSWNFCLFSKITRQSRWVNRFWCSNNDDRHNSTCKHCSWTS